MKESEHLELKKSTSELKEAIISIASILNKHKHGELYFGIKNDGEVVGQMVTENTIREISKTISDHIEPKIYPKINEINLNQKKCIHLEFSGNNVPYYAYGRAYLRVGDEDKKMSAPELERFILQKNNNLLHFDMELCSNAKLSDIDQEKVNSFVIKTGLENNSPKESLEKLGLIKKGSLVNTAVLLFAKHPEHFFPNVKLRCAVFGTKDTSVTIDMHDYTGDIFTLIERAEEYVFARINIGMRLEGLRRVDVPEIDRAAFREAIINAFCHRDYREYDTVNIALFKDRLEIRSPGELYGGLTIKRIKQGTVSKRRNELIAEMFHRVHLVEKWGRGIKLILSKEPTTKFTIVAGLFITTFIRKGVERGVERGVEKLSDHEQKIIHLINENPRISKAEMVEKGHLSKKAVEYNIECLKKKNIITRVGGAKGGHWEIILKDI